MAESGDNTPPVGGQEAETQAGSAPLLTWFEFAWRPQLLETHLASLDAGTCSQPSAVELTVGFLDVVLRQKSLEHLVT